MSKMAKYYGYFIPASGDKGVVDNWIDCEKKVKGVFGARFKSFTNRDAAEKWVEEGADYSNKETFSPGIYFDAGTGRGDGVEVSVTDEMGDTLLTHVFPVDRINRYGKHLLPSGVTNNYGELLGCYLALKVALKLHVKKIYGDSALVINYWSKGHIKKKLAQETIELSKKTKMLRETFEKSGGVLELVSGGANPADLGFH